MEKIFIDQRRYSSEQGAEESGGAGQEEDNVYEGTLEESQEKEGVTRCHGCYIRLIER